MFFRLWKIQVCGFVKWFERRLTLTIYQVTMSEVVEVSEKADLQKQKMRYSLDSHHVVKELDVMIVECFL